MELEGFNGVNRPVPPNSLGRGIMSKSTRKMLYDMDSIMELEGFNANLANSCAHGCVTTLHRHLYHLRSPATPCNLELLDSKPG